MSEAQAELIAIKKLLAQLTRRVSTLEGMLAGSGKAAAPMKTAASDADVDAEDDGEPAAKRRKPEAHDGDDDDDPLTPQQDDNGNPYFQLNEKRRLTISDFRGRKLVDIREWYEKDGQKRPGKGISLSVDQWRKLQEHMDELDAKFDAGDLSYAIELGNKRRASVSMFGNKNTKFVNIREYYSDASGELKPGKKGVALPEDQWRVLITLAGAVDEHLEE